MRRKLALFFCLPVLFFAVAVHAQSQTASAPPVSGFRAEFLGQMTEVEEKLVGLAQAVPAEKYSWRPSEGIRSVSEVYMHIAGGNYLLLQFIGMQPPAGLSRDMEKITDKAKVIDTLKQSFDFVRQAVGKTSDADLERRVKFFNSETTVRDVLFSLAMHMHEHLGQSIAYARMNGVVPPWTAAQQNAGK